MVLIRAPLQDVATAIQDSMEEFNGQCIRLSYLKNLFTYDFLAPRSNLATISRFVTLVNWPHSLGRVSPFPRTTTWPDFPERGPHNKQNMAE